MADLWGAAARGESLDPQTLQHISNSLGHRATLLGDWGAGVRVREIRPVAPGVNIARPPHPSMLDKPSQPWPQWQ